VCGGQFCTNLYTLLMKRPLGGMAVLGVDPVLVRP
jgi:transcriptional accessory protein Tex/SPT6